MDPRDYFREVVKPSIDRFEEEPKSIALAYAACVFAYPGGAGRVLGRR